MFHLLISQEKFAPNGDKLWICASTYLNSCKSFLKACCSFWFLSYIKQAVIRFMIRVNIVVTHECQEVFGCHLGVSWCLFPSAKGPCPPNIYLRKKCASWVWEPTWSNDALREAKFCNIWLHAAITFIKKNKKQTNNAPNWHLAFACRIQFICSQFISVSHD